jgi:hypothetical protein
MENISHKDLQAISNYIGLGIHGTREEILERIQAKCNSSDITHGADESKSPEPADSTESVGATEERVISPTGTAATELPGFKRQLSDTVFKHARESDTTINMTYLFNSRVFLEMADDDLSDALCLKISFPNTPAGIHLKDSKIELYDNILHRISRTELIKNFVFIPSFYTTSGNLFVCDLEMFENFSSESSSKKQLKIKTALTYNKFLVPNKKSLFRLLHCVITGVKWILVNGLNINSLSLDSIIYAQPAKFYITDFTQEKSNANKYKQTLVDFLADILTLYDNYSKNTVITRKALVKSLHERTELRKQSLTNPGYKDSSYHQNDNSAITKTIPGQIVGIDRKLRSLQEDSDPIIQALANNIYRPLKNKSNIDISFIGHILDTYLAEIYPLIEKHH